MTWMRGPRQAVPFGALVTLSLSLGACGSSTVRGEGGDVDPELSMSFREDVATGSQTNAFLRYDCPSGTSSRDCNRPDNASATIEAVTVDDPTILEVVRSASSPDILTLKALRDGTTNIRVGGARPDGRSKKDFLATIRVATPDRVALEPDRGCSKPIRVGVNGKFKIKAKLFKGPTELAGNPYPFPIKSDVAKLPPGDIALSGIELEAQEKRGVGTIESTVSPEDSLAVEVYDEEQVAGIELTLSSGASGTLGGHPLVKKGATVTLSGKINVTTEEGTTAPLCAENLERSITSDRPDVCTGSRVHSGQGLVITTKEAGTCTVTVRIGAFTAKQTIEVRENARGF